MKDNAHLEDVELRWTESNRASYLVTIDYGENRQPDLATGRADDERLVASLTKLRELQPGDEVMEPGANGSPDRAGTVLHHHHDSGRVAYVQDGGSPIIGERHRLLRRAKEGRE